MTLVKFKNGQTNGVLKSPYSDILNSFFNPEPYSGKGYVTKIPAVNVAETEHEFLIELATPGLKKEDFKISVEKDQLTISAEQKLEEGGAAPKNYSRKEFNYRSFSRTFNLPETADDSKINAEYTDGILYVTISKKEEAKIQVREIAVK